MKKHSLFLATILVVAAISVAVVSCKKETQNAPLKPVATLQGFNPLEIEDMNAYLDGFRTKMQSASAKGDDEAISLEDAAWHLSSLANYEFANINVECDGVRFDTLYAQVNVTNGAVLLSDLDVAYETISSSIDKFFNGLTLNNKHFRFINAHVSENGVVTIPLMITYSNGMKGLDNHAWYYDDEWAAIYACDTIFPSTNIYDPSSTGLTALNYELNLVASHAYFNVIQTPPMNPVYYTYASEQLFDHEHYPDPYGSDFNNKRVFNHYYHLYDLEQYGMCYLYDSYLGLGFDNCPTGQEIVSWVVTYYKTPENHPTNEFHTLTVIYGIQHGGPIPGNNDDE